MRLIGIKFESCTEAYLKKNLVDGTWYPFGEFSVKDEPTQNNISSYKANLKNRKSNGLYFIKGMDGRRIDVNISCIVGKNGSGKSTIIDMLLAIINNFAAEYLKSYKVGVIHIEGIYASLYYEIDSMIYEIECAGEKTTLNQIDSNGKTQFRTSQMDVAMNLPIVFFYTMVLNYSLYSFNTNDYKTKVKQEDEDIWLHHLFHKNDAYLTPVVLNPFRDKGNMNINKENNLACQRLSVILLQLAFSGTDLLPGYKAVNLLYTHNTRYRKMPSKIEEWNKEKYKNEKGKWKPYQHEPFTIIYNYIRSEFIECDSECVLAEELFNYMAYKVIKICRNYVDFQEVFDVFRCAKELSEGKIKQVGTYKKSISDVIKKIEGSDTHITCKYNQTKKFLSNPTVYDIHKEKYGTVQRKPLCAILDGALEHLDYWRIYKLLPPPIYDLDVEFVDQRRNSRKRKITFKSMSSGERQLLFSLSSTMYHIKNIESVLNDKNRIQYHHITLILDEVELYSHPEYQRDYIKNVLERLSRINIDRNEIHSINILVVTHSPFILSDICKENTLYMQNGVSVPLIGLKDTFGANYYDLLMHGFFLETGAAGAWAAKVFKTITGKDESADKLDLDDVQKVTFAKLFGDPLISGILQEKVIEINNKNKKS